MTTEQLPVTEELGQAVAEAAATEPVAAIEQSVADFDLSTIDGIRRAAEQNPVLREWREQGFEAGRQKREKELRDERGSDEAAQAHHEWVVSQLALGVDPKDLAKQTPTFVSANRNRARVEQARTYAERVLDAFSVEERGQITTALELLADEPDRIEEIVSGVIDTALERKSSAKIAELTFDQLLEQYGPDSAVRKTAEAWARSQAEQELEARQMETETKPNPPRPASNGGAGVTSIDRLAAMSEAEQKQYIASLSDEEFMRVKADLFPV